MPALAPASGFGILWEKKGVLLAGSSLLLGTLIANGLFRFPPCILRQVTGIPCPTCGGLHAIEALKSGHPLDALWFNPLLVMTLAAALLYMPYALGVLYTNFPRLQPPTSIASERRLHRGLLLLLGLNWLWIIFRP